MTRTVTSQNQQFRHEGLLDVVGAALRESGLPPHRLELEITETAMLNDGEQMLAVLTHLRGFGIRLSVDDFGTAQRCITGKSSRFSVSVPNRASTIQS